jgi:hypothetical protein
MHVRGMPEDRSKDGAKDKQFLCATAFAYFGADQIRSGRYSERRHRIGDWISLGDVAEWALILFAFIGLLASFLWVHRTLRTIQSFSQTAKLSEKAISDTSKATESKHDWQMPMFNTR